MGTVYRRQAQRDSIPTPMPSPGRNDPCPCGSRRKFKHCCGNAAQPVTGLPTPADRTAGYALLDRLAALPRFAEDIRLAFSMVWRDLPDADLGRLMETQARDLFLEWLWFDYQFHTGQTLAEYALTRHAADVGPGTRQFLQATAAAPFRLLQVVKVEPGARVHVRDVIDKGATIVVLERRGSEQLVRHDVLVTRIAAYGDEQQFEGLMLLLGVADKTGIAAAVRRIRRRITHELSDDAERDAMLRMAGCATIVMEVIDLFNRPQPKVTVGGSEMALADALFTVVNLDDTRAALDRAADLEQVEGGSESPGELARYTWLERPRLEDDGPIRVLGSVVLERATLRVETMSMTRARLAQSHFSAVIPRTAVRFKAIQVRNMQAALAESRARPRTAEPEIPPELVAQIQRDFYEKHYREWLDIPVPALGHRTPREAAGVKKLRARLVILVEGIEVQAARQAKEREGFDARFLRRELGLPSLD
ncbi:MAG: hypothetical protein CK533_12805 [Acidobacterium sp.]|nr:MAG: hypothetical protein CK533_12805 [Acidobacterium sp.]